MHIGIRTPVAKQASDKSPPKAQTPERSVRKSIGEWEATHADPTPTLSPAATTQMAQAGPAPISNPKPGPSKATKTAPARKANSPVVKIFVSKTAEARALHDKAKTNINTGKNIRTDIKNDVIEALDRLYQMVKELDAQPKKTKTKTDMETSSTPVHAPDTAHALDPSLDQGRIMSRLEEHTRLLLENSEKLREIKDAIDSQKEATERMSYASAVTAGTKKQPVGGEAVHSVVVTSTNEQDTGEEVMERVRQAVNAKEGWIKVERARKAKDRKVVMGCGSEEDRRKIKERLETVGVNLVVEEVKNRDPLLVLKGVLVRHSDEEVMKALKNQNREIFHDLEEQEDRTKIKFRKKARNPHTCDIVLTVPPRVWQRAIGLQRIRVDLQRVRVEDQSPLVQCSMCLGYGHGRRFCTETQELCSHCGGPHLKATCPDRAIEERPECINCKRAKIENCNHNAFSQECPIRKKWDRIARSTVAYC